LQEENEVVAGYLATQSKVQERIGYRWYTVAIACILIIPGIILAFRNISLYLIQRRYSHRPYDGSDGARHTAYADQSRNNDVLEQFKQSHQPSDTRASDYSHDGTNKSLIAIHKEKCDVAHYAPDGCLRKTLII
jgi:hypothetical protein